MINQIIFVVVLSIVGFFAYKLYGRILRNIRFGKKETISGDSGERLKNTLLVAFGQKKMFKRMIPALLHLAIYVAFLFTQIDLVEIIIDGVFGTHRIFINFLGPLYPIIISTIEILSVLAFIATLIFLIRRNVMKIDRFEKPEMKGWPKKDANLILIGEILLVFGIFMMNGADVVLQGMSFEGNHYHSIGTFAVSSILGPSLFGGLDHTVLIIIERLGWWLHTLVVFGFILYLPMSKHFHIFLAFPNVYFSKLTPRGEMENMPTIMNEVKVMMELIPPSEDEDMEELPEFGSKDITDLSWKNILDAYTCTECGRCTSVCPANLTGKELSPRQVVMSVRDRTEEISKNIDINNVECISSESEVKDKLDISNYDDGKTLFDYISKESLHACTTCNACVEACPVMINPLDVILKMRRYEILTESQGPADWTPMFTSLENSGSVWSIPDERDAWKNQL